MQALRPELTYTRFWAGKHNTALNFEFAEAPRRPDGLDCIEAASDKELHRSSVKIIESTAARIHVRWTAQPCDLNYKVRGETATEDFYFYPDCFGSRAVTLPTEPKAEYEIEELLILTPPAGYPLRLLPENLIDVLFSDHTARTRCGNGAKKKTLSIQFFCFIEVGFRKVFPFAPPTDAALAMPTISILIPVSGVNWLNTCISSVLRQSFRDFELIIGDDTESDHAGAIVRRWGDPRIRYIRNSTPLGLIENRNYLLSICRGRFVKILSDRDFLYVNGLADSVGVLEKTGAPLVFHNRRIVNPHGLIVSSPVSVPQGSTPVSVELLTQYVVAQRDNFIGEGANMLFEREASQTLSPAFGVDCFQLGSLGMLALCIQLALRSPIIGAGVVGSATRQIKFSKTGNIPDDVCSEFFDWEILQRWAVDQGFIPESEWTKISAKNLEIYNSESSSNPSAKVLTALRCMPQQGPLLDQSFREAVATASALHRNRR